MEPIGRTHSGPIEAKNPNGSIASLRRNCLSRAVLIFFPRIIISGPL